MLSLTNLYIGLKAGWGFGVAITACILSYAIWTGLHRAGIVRTPMTILENNCMQSTASSAGYSTGGTLISAFAAWMLISNATMSLPLMLGWVFLLAVLGVTMAIPMKRQMINIEQLRFPSGIAAAETLRALHSVGGQGMRSARALAWAAGLAMVGKLWAEGLVTGQCETRAAHDRFVDGGPQPSPVRTRLDGADGDDLMGAHVHRGRRHHGTPRGLEHAPRKRDGLDDLRARAAGGRSHRGQRLRRARAVDAVGRRGLHGQREPALLRPAVADRAARLR